jgi:hypothetical protein
LIPSIFTGSFGDRGLLAIEFRQVYQLAQINVARLVAAIDHPRIADFVSQLELVNRLADLAQGFVWRLESAFGDATDWPTMTTLS